MEKQPYHHRHHHRLIQALTAYATVCIATTLVMYCQFIGQ